VAVLEEPSESNFRIDPKDLEESFTRGSGAGGQHRNKTDTAVILLHKPTSIQVRVDGGRSQWANRQSAMALLRARLQASMTADKTKNRNKKRKNQVGSGMRGDKIRTISYQRDSVTDHRNGKTIKLRAYLKGDLKDLR